VPCMATRYPAARAIPSGSRISRAGFMSFRWQSRHGLAASGPRVSIDSWHWLQEWLDRIHPVKPSLAATAAKWAS